MTAEVKVISMSVIGRELTFQCSSDNEASLRASVEYFNKQAESITGANKYSSRDALTTAILAAINVCNEHLKLLSKTEHLDELEDKLQQIGTEVGALLEFLDHKK